jgi:plasmid maintenance system antidote protein VapI
MRNRRRVYRRQSSVTNEALDRLVQVVEGIADTSRRLAQAAQRLEDAACSQKGVFSLPGAISEPKIIVPTTFDSEANQPRQNADETACIVPNLPRKSTPPTQHAVLAKGSPGCIEKSIPSITVRSKEDGTYEVDTAEWDAYHEQFKENPKSQINPAWVAFYRGVFEAQDLIEKRRIACAACSVIWKLAEEEGTLDGIHPGTLLQRDFLGRPGIDRQYLAYILDLNYAALERLLRGEMVITAKLAEKLTGRFDLPKAWWMNLQGHYCKTTTSSKS